MREPCSDDKLEEVSMARVGRGEAGRQDESDHAWPCRLFVFVLKVVESH